MSSAAAPLLVSTEQREVLGGWARSHVIPHRQSVRARVVLRAARGTANGVIAARLGVSKPSVLKWRSRCADAGVEGLDDAPGRGRPPMYDRRFVEKVIATTLRKPPRGVTHWSTRTLAEHLGVSHGTIHEIWRDAGLQPHRTRTFKYSSDPKSEEKVTDVVGLSMNPPENAIVLCVDEKTQLQALDSGAREELIGAGRAFVVRARAELGRATHVYVDADHAWDPEPVQASFPLCRLRVLVAGRGFPSAALSRRFRAHRTQWTVRLRLTDWADQPLQDRRHVERLRDVGARGEREPDLAPPEPPRDQYGVRVAGERQGRVRVAQDLKPDAARKVRTRAPP